MISRNEKTILIVITALMLTSLALYGYVASRVSYYGPNAVSVDEVRRALLTYGNVSGLNEETFFGTSSLPVIQNAEIPERDEAKNGAALITPEVIHCIKTHLTQDDVDRMLAGDEPSPQAKEAMDECFDGISIPRGNGEEPPQPEPTSYEPSEGFTGILIKIFSPLFGL